MSDGWVTVPASGRGGQMSDAVFNQSAARLPKPQGTPDRGNWQVNPARPDLVRFVYVDDGQLKASRNGNYSDAYRSVSKQSLQTQLGRVLTGRFPVTVEGNAVVIDISEQMS